MAIHVAGALITSDQTSHSARSVGLGGWAVSWLPGRTITTEQAIAAIQLAEAASQLAALASMLGLPPCEAVGKAMLDFRPVNAQTALIRTPHAQVRGLR